VELTRAFTALYGSSPTHRVIAPGRINLIGEHIDYAGLPVLPMAIQRRIAIVFRSIDKPECRIASSAPGLEPRVFRLDAAIEPYAAGDWGNYVKAAAAGLRERGMGPRGVEALITSDLPVAAGLSSSSALVVGCALSFLTAAAESLPPLELAALMAEAEQFTGTRGGGMDQAICLCAHEGTASVVDFDPLAIEPVAVPDDWRFVVAHSLVEARKSGDVQATYNRRREEVETSLSEMGPALGASPSSGAAELSFKALLASRTTEELLNAAERTLEPDSRRRFRHVVTEAGRVRLAADAMKAADVSAFGALMNASHQSLRNDFEVSTPELDELVEIALDAGASGARLTGAGLGGSAVALVSASRSASVVRALVDRFYASRRPPAATERSGIFGDALFVAVPSAGASVQRIDPGRQG